MRFRRCRLRRYGAATCAAMYHVARRTQRRGQWAQLGSDFDSRRAIAGACSQLQRDTGKRILSSAGPPSGQLASNPPWRGLGYRHTSESPETLLGATQLTIGALADWRNGRICHWAIASCGGRTEIRSRAVRQRKNHIGPPREFRPAKDAVEAAKERCSPPSRKQRHN